MSGEKVFPCLLPKDGGVVQVQVERKCFVKKATVEKHVYDDDISAIISNSNRNKSLSRSAISKAKARRNPEYREKENKREAERKKLKRQNETQEERDETLRKRREARKKGTRPRKIPKKNSITPVARKEEIVGNYKILQVRELTETVTNFHSVEPISEAPKKAGELVYINCDNEIRPARRPKTRSQLARLTRSRI